MKTARCLNPKCNFVIRGNFKHGPPKSCPACNFDRSAEVLQKMADAKIQEKPDDCNKKRT